MCYSTALCASMLLRDMADDVLVRYWKGEGNADNVPHRLRHNDNKKHRIGIRVLSNIH